MFKQKLILNPRIFAILFLGFSSGLPLVLTGSTLQAWYTVAGVNLLTIGALSLVGQPYLYKFIWAPILDRFMPIPMGRRRGWILIMQLLLVIGLAVMAFLNPAQNPGFLAIIALVVAFFSATQDIAIDAYRTDVLDENERGLGASMNTVGYRLAVLVAGALALILAAKIGWHTTYLIMAGLMVVEAGLTFYAPHPKIELPPPTHLIQAVIAPLKEFMSRKNAVVILVFIVTYKLCDALALSLNTTFLIRGVGFSLVEIGSISKVVSLSASLIGSVIGGLLLPRLGLYRSLMLFGILQMSSNLLFSLLAIVGKSYWLMAGSLFAENFLGGAGTIAFLVFIMGLCDRRYTATQFALLSAFSAVGRVLVGPEAAVIVTHVGWAQFYVWTFFMGIPALFLLWWLKLRASFVMASE